MSTSFPARSGSRRGRNVRPIRPERPPEAPPAITIDQPDLGYIFALVSLISVGVVMMYSTISITGDNNDLLRAARWLGLGLISLPIAASLPLKFWRWVTPWFLLGCLVALASLHIEGNPLAVTTNGATRWLKVPGGQLQPSEFAKLAFLLFAAQFLEKRGGPRMRLPAWASYLGVLLAFMGLIYGQPDLGTALVIGAAAYCLLIIAGAQWRYLIGGALLAGIVVFALAWSLPQMKHQKDRLLSWRDPWAEEYRQQQGHQVIQSYTALARGGLWGVGLGRSIQKMDNRLPESENDFVFAILAEEMGLIRAAGVILLFGLLAWRGYAIAARAPDRYGGLLVAGITSWIAVQSLMNVAVVTGSIPNTGVPLPFISSGGSSMLALMTAAGIVIGISRQRAVASPVPKEVTRP